MARAKSFERRPPKRCTSRPTNRQSSSTFLQPDKVSLTWTMSRKGNILLEDYARHELAEGPLQASKPTPRPCKPCQMPCRRVFGIDRLYRGRDPAAGLAISGFDGKGMRFRKGSSYLSMPDTLLPSCGNWPTRAPHAGIANGHPARCFGCAALNDPSPPDYIDHISFPPPTPAAGPECLKCRTVPLSLPTFRP